MNQIITPDDVEILIPTPDERINADENAVEVIRSFIKSEWGTESYQTYVDEILSLFQSVDGTYGVVDVVTFIISHQYRDSFVGVHKSLSMEDLFPFVGVECESGALELGEVTENIKEDITVLNSF